MINVTLKGRSCDDTCIVSISPVYIAVNECLPLRLRSIFQQASRLHSTYEWPLVYPLVVDNRAALLNIVTIIKTVGYVFQRFSFSCEVTFSSIVSNIIVAVVFYSSEYALRNI